MNDNAQGRPSRNFTDPRLNHVADMVDDSTHSSWFRHFRC